MRELVYALSAQAELNNIFRYIVDEHQDLTAALTLVGKLRDKCNKLAAVPSILGRPRADIGEGVRSTPCGDYVIFFRYGENRLDILAILHAHRDVIAYFGDDA